MEAAQDKRSLVLPVLFWGALWGIFEATAGYLLHLLPISIGWLVWFPASCFFMANVYRRTRRVSSIMYMGVLSASIKMLNLLLPGSIDRVLNPAFSIVFEALSVALAAATLQRLAGGCRSPLAGALAIVGMNTGWRLMYIAYLLLLVPAWMREISVLSSAQKLLEFLVLYNAGTCGVLFVGWLLYDRIMGAAARVERWMAGIRPRHAPWPKYAAAALLLGADILLSLWL